MAGENETFTKEQVDALIAERIAAETEGLKRSQKELLAEKKAAQAKLAALPEGFDPEEFKALKAEKEARERKKATDEGDFKSLEAQLVTKYETQIQAEQAEKKRYAAAMERHLVDSALAQELAKHSDSPKLLMPHLRSHLKVMEVDGEFVARIVDAAGNVRIGKGQGSSPMTIAEFAEEARSNAEYGPLFRGSGSSGGGASKSASSAGGQSVIPAGDNVAFIANVDNIAKGKAKVAA